jgi:hypothetical protein
MKKIAPTQDIYVSRPLWEQNLSDFISNRNRSSAQSQESTDTLDSTNPERFLVLGGVGGAGKSLLKENIQHFYSQSDTETPLIQINFEVDKELLTESGSQFLWPEILLKASTQINKDISKPGLLNRLTNYFKLKFEYFSGFEYLYNTYISEKNSTAENSKNKRLLTAFTFGFVLLAALTQKYIEDSLKSGFWFVVGSIAVIALSSVSSDLIKTFLLKLKFRLYKSLYKLTFDEKKIKDGADLKEKERFTCNTSLFNHPEKLINVFKSELTYLLSKQKNEVNILLVFDVNKLTDDISRELINFCELLIKPSSEEDAPPLNMYDRSVKVLLVSKHRSQISHAISQSKFVTENRKPRLLDLKSLDEVEAKELVMRKLEHFVKFFQDTKSDSIADNTLAYLHCDELKWKKQKQKARREKNHEFEEQLKLVESLGNILINGIHGITSRLANTVNIRCDVFLKTFGSYSIASLHDLVESTTETKSEGIVEHISETIKHELNEPFERLFHGNDNHEALKHSVILIHCFESVTYEDWRRLTGLNLESFEELVARGYLIDSHMGPTGELRLYLKRHVSDIVAVHPDRYRIAEKGLLSFYRSLTGIHNLPNDKTEFRTTQIELINQAINCFCAPANIQKLNSLDWPLSEFTSLLKLALNAYHYCDTSEDVESELSQSIIDSTFKCILNFFAFTTDTARDYWDQVVFDTEWLEALDVMSKFIELKNPNVQPRLLSLSTVSQIFDLKVGLKRILIGAAKDIIFDFKKETFFVKRNCTSSSNIEALILFHNWGAKLLKNYKRWQYIDEERSFKGIVPINDLNQQKSHEHELLQRLTKLYDGRKVKDKNIGKVDLKQLLITYTQLLSELQNASLSDNQTVEFISVLRKLVSFLLTQREKLDSGTLTEFENDILEPFYDFVTHECTKIMDPSLKAQLVWFQIRTPLYYFCDLRDANLEVTILSSFKSWNEALLTMLSLHSYLGEEDISTLLESIPNIQKCNKTAALELLHKVEFPLSFPERWQKINETVDLNLRLLQKVNRADHFPTVVDKFSHFLSKATKYAEYGQVKDETAINRQMRIAFSGLAYSKTTSHQLPESTVKRLRELYARALIKHLEQRSILRRAESLFESKLHNNNYIENEIEQFSTAQLSSTEDLFSYLLRIISRFNPNRGELKAGDFLVCKVSEIQDDAFKLTALHSDITPVVERNFLPITLYNEVFNKRDIETNSEPWEGRLILLQAVAQNTTKDNDNSDRFTAKGAEYIGGCLHLFFPTAKSWAHTNPRRTRVYKNFESNNADSELEYESYEQIKTDNNIVWEGDLWMGASNSWAALRLTGTYKSMFLASEGKLQKELVNGLGIRRLTAFEKCGVSDRVSAQLAERTEIRHFTNDAYSDLEVFFGENDEVLFAVNTDFVDPRKLRSFSSIFTKIFDVSFAIMSE